MLNLNIRNHRIDFLRGIAILLVLVLHFHIAYHLDQSAFNKIFSVAFIKAISENGNYGVTLFFVVSGFLITSMTLERYGEFRKVDIVGFYIFRFARIMPCLLLALAIIVLLSCIPIHIFQNKPNTTSLTLAVISVLTFWHNVLMQKVGYFNYPLNIYWSLSVEEVFYIAFPIFCLLLRRERFIIPFWIALIITGPIYRSFYTNDEIVALYGYFSCFDGIAIGCCAAVIARKVELKGWFGKAIQYIAALTAVTTYFYKGIMAIVVPGISLMALSIAILLIGAVQGQSNEKTLSNKGIKAICWFGKNSYELYLFHIILLAMMKEIYTAPSLDAYSKLVWMAVFFSISALVAGTISKFYSQPLNKKLREALCGLRQQDMLLSSKHLA